MPGYSQANRPLRVDTVLGGDALLLERFSGVEAVSAPFCFQLRLLSEDPQIVAEQLLRSPAVLTAVLPAGGERKVHGLISRFAQLGQQDELTFYRAELVAWPWFLSLSRDIRIFQNLSVLEIVEQVFQSRGYSDFEIRCTQAYAKRDYCVQYRETDLDFVSRLLEDEGIFYFFEHSDAKHVMVLTDDNSSIKPLDGQPEARMAVERVPEEDVVLSLTDERFAYIGAVTLGDYDYLRPSLSLRTSVSGNGKEEVYDYPGNYAAIEDGERYARLRLEEREAQARRLTGEGTCRAFRSGGRFDLSDHYRHDLNQSYTLLEVRHTGSAGDYRSWGTAEIDYRNEFTAIPHDVPFRPARRTPKPLVRGSQTAAVVGKAGEEIWVDKYGRVKVQFNWDRAGSRDENSSCWVRVAHPWAGKSWGSVAIPRVGDEVVVEFLDGDPDRPIITGSVYNADQPAPFDLPGRGMVMGLKSRSTPGGGGYNEISMSDEKGKEAVTIHAQRDMVTTVENDQTSTINNNRVVSIAVDDTGSVGSNQALGVTGNQTLDVKGNRTATVGADDSLTIAAQRKQDVGGDETVSVGGARSVSVGTNQQMDIGAEHTLTAGANITLDAGARVVITGSASVEIQAPRIALRGDAEVTLSVAGSIVSLKPSGVEISGSAIKTAAQAVNEITGATVKVN